MKPMPLRRLQRRVVMISAAVLAVALVLTGLFVVTTVEQRLIAGVDDEIERRMHDITDRLRTETLAPELPTVSDPQDIVVQVVRAGKVVSRTGNARDLAPLDRICSDGFASIHFDTIDQSPFRIETRCVDASGTVVVHVAVNQDDVRDSVRALSISLALALPVLLVGTCIALWLLVGRLLRPVALAAEREARFVADASHELRAPLARMIAALEVDGAQAVDSVLGDARSLSGLTDDLLVLARLDANATIRSDVVDLDDVVWRAIERRTPQTDAPGVDLSGVSAGQVVGDAVLLERVVVNLLDNAIRHAQRRVAVTLSTVSGVVRLDVTDDGPGIAPELRDAVFDRFTRGDDVRTPGRGGTGLGLAIARAIVIAHRGHLTIVDQSLGCCLRVEIPVATR